VTAVGRETGRRRRGIGCLGILAALLVVLLVALGVVDRVAAGVAEDRLADEVALAARAENAVPEGTTAEIDGYPFLTQVWSGEYDGGRIGLQTLRTQQLTIANVDVEISQLTIPRDVLFGAEPHDITAARMRGSATVSLTEIAARLGVPQLKITGDGNRVRFSANVVFRGITAPVGGVADVRLQGSRVWLDVAEVSAAGIPLPEQALTIVRRQLAAGVTIPPLPYALRLTGIRVDGSTVRVDAAADNVPLVQ
jgi:hypothetical protein